MEIRSVNTHAAVNSFVFVCFQYEFIAEVITQNLSCGDVYSFGQGEGCHSVFYYYIVRLNLYFSYQLCLALPQFNNGYHLRQDVARPVRDVYTHKRLPFDYVSRKQIHPMKKGLYGFDQAECIYECR